MQVKINKPLKIENLRFGRYLPRAIRGANPLLGSWVSPTYINFPNRLFRSDANTIRGRLRYSVEDNTTSDLVNGAFREKWFNWRLVNAGQVLVHDGVKDDEGNWKTLIFKIRADLFKGESGYRRFLAMAAVIEYFAAIYPKKFKTLFVVFNPKKGVKNPIFNKYSSLYKNSYLSAGTTNLLGSLSLLGKIYRIGKSL